MTVVSSFNTVLLLTPNRFPVLSLVILTRIDPRLFAESSLRYSGVPFFEAQNIPGFCRADVCIPFPTLFAVFFVEEVSLLVMRLEVVFPRYPRETLFDAMWNFAFIWLEFFARVHRQAHLLPLVDVLFGAVSVSLVMLGSVEAFVAFEAFVPFGRRVRHLDRIVHRDHADSTGSASQPSVGVSCTLLASG